MANTRTHTNRELLLPYALPLLLYVGIGLLSGGRLSRELGYGARAVAAAAALAWAWRSYVPLTGPGAPATSIGVGAAVGLLGTLLWVALLRPFADGAGSPWSPAAFWLRAATATLVVPIFEELAIRGYVLRLAVQWDHARRDGAPHALQEALDRHAIDELEAGAWTPLAVLISAGVFALGHTVPEWPAAIAYGLLMAGLWIARKDLLSCVTAHAITNLCLALLVRSTGQWALW